ncbi:MAG: response regulator transcription factor [Lachnospiraceae bacterium]|nr:response regulator transcription factor [Lachnospiraceae bacterium]
MKQILIVDDDIYIGNMLEEVLRKEGYEVLRAYSGTEALLVLKLGTPDLVLLDLMLPGLNGEAVLPEIKNIPVIIMSAKCGADCKVELLLGGAVDYVTKPFDVKELLARITVQLRKASANTESSVIKAGDITLNTDTHEAMVNDHSLKLTRTEYAILKTLINNSKQVVTKTILLEKLSEDTPDCTESSLKMHVSNLRKKLREVSDKEYIEAVWGIGFKINLD